MLRLSVTELETWRYFLQYAWMDEQMLLERLRGNTEVTDAMLAGTAWHAILADSKPGDEIVRAERDGFRFHVKLTDSLSVPPVREVRVEQTVNIDGVPVILQGTADTFDGYEVDDHKTTEVIRLESYLDSFQWRSYLWMFGAKKFTYNVFEVKEWCGVWEVTDLQRFSVYPYPGMEADVKRQLTELVRYIRKNVPERVETPIPHCEPGPELF